MMDCGLVSTIFVSNHDLLQPQSFAVNGQQLWIPPASTLTFQCTGETDIVPWGNIAVKMIPAAQSIIGTEILLGLAGVITAAMVVKAIFVFFRSE